MTKKFEVHYSLRGTITIEAESESQARELLLNSDHTDTSELFLGVEANIVDAGNDAIEIDDVVVAER